MYMKTMDVVKSLSWIIKSEILEYIEIENRVRDRKNNCFFGPFLKKMLTSRIYYGILTVLIQLIQMQR